MRKIHLPFLIVFCLSSLCFSQRETNIWRFGRAYGINFNSGSPVPFSITVPTIMDASEGCSSVCDPSGNLLFYTDGRIVYDRLNQVMSSGLNGGVSSTQAGFIAPYVGNLNRYYVFTTDGITSGGSGTWIGLNYTVIDMSIGANGNVVAGLKNRALVDSTCEKVTAVMHANGIDFWVITRKHFTNNWYAFLVNCNGPDTLNPVVTSIGSSGYGKGYLKSSLDGKMLINAVAGVEVFDFDNATGVLSNYRLISNNTNGYYGISMSPNDSLIYVGQGTSVYRYERFAPSINATETVFTFTTGTGIGALQLASDKKIYSNIGNGTAISVLQTPNNIAGPGLLANAVTGFGFGQVNGGLPCLFDQRYFGPKPQFAGADSSICNGSSVTIGSSSIPGLTYQWKPASGLSNTAIANPIASPTATTNYMLFAYNACDTVFDTVTVVVDTLPILNSTTNLSLCNGASALLSASGAVNFLWSPAVGLSSTTGHSISAQPSSSQSYTVVGTDGNNCSATTIITVNVNQLPVINISGNTSICEGNSALLSVSGATNYQWSPAAGLSNTTGTQVVFNQTSGSSYTVTGIDANGCSAVSTVSITVNSIPVAYAGSDTTICERSSVQLQATGGGAYSWSTGATSSAIIVNPNVQTVYSVTVSNGDCFDEDLVTVFILPLPQANAGNNITIATGATTILTASGGGTYSWFPSQGLSCITCQSLIASPQGTTKYYVTVTDINGCTSLDSVLVTVETACNDLYIPTAFSPNDDGQNDIYIIEGKNCIREMRFTIYNRWGEIIFESTDASLAWDGTYKNKLLDAGVFTFRLGALLTTGEQIIKKGNITLVR